MENKVAMTGNIIYFIIGFIILIAVAIPITNEVITTANLSGLTKTVVQYVPVFLAIGGLVLAVMSTGIMPKK